MLTGGRVIFAQFLFFCQPTGIVVHVTAGFGALASLFVVGPWIGGKKLMLGDACCSDFFFSSAIWWGRKRMSLEGDAWEMPCGISRIPVQR